MKHLLLFILTLFVGTFSFASEKDSIKFDEAKHYFKNSLNIGVYKRPEKRILGTTSTYEFSQMNIAGLFPVLTKTKINTDNSTTSTFHLLVTGNLQANKITVGKLIQDQTFRKFSLGLRGIYETNDKNIWFFDVSPFNARQRNSIKTEPVRISGVFLYNRIVNDKFSFKLGIYRTFLFGQLYNLPIIGFRAGNLDGVNVQFTFPRNLSLNIPVSQKLSTSVFFKPNGGVFAIANPYLKDATFLNQPKVLQVGRTEYLSGASLNYSIDESFQIYGATGLSTRANLIYAAKSNINKDRIIRRHSVEPSLFLNIGFVYRWGKTKSALNRKAIDEIKSLNNQWDAGDNNIGNTTNDGNQNPVIKKQNNLKYGDIQDYIENVDLN